MEIYLNPVATELTTAATDMALSVIAFTGLVWLRGRVPADPRRRLWTAILGSLGISALLGAVVHGWELPAAANDVLWAGVLAGLSLGAALFPVAALYEYRGWNAARALLPWVLAAGVGAWIFSQFSDWGLNVLLVSAGVAAVCALAMFVLAGAATTVASTARGTGLLAAAVLLNLVASGIQARGTLELHLIWPFDHNGICHMIQIVGLVLLVLGVDRLGSRSPTGGDAMHGGPHPTARAERSPA